MSLWGILGIGCGLVERETLLMGEFILVGEGGI